MPETSAKPGKNIVICCDGTGNMFGDANSNVVKLYTALIVNNEQVGYYHPGVGTMGAPTSRTRLEKEWSRIDGLAFAGGFMDKVEDAYRYLMERYNDEDHIYLFGFSRGSYTIRALAGILHAYGLLCKGNEGQIPYVFRMFLRDVKKMHQAKQHTVQMQTAFKETFSHDVTVRFEGLWDTVSSVGWVTSPLQLLYSAQNPIVQTARHAISIDERRCFYRDNLLGPSLPRDRTPTLPDPQDTLQVWFAGVHSDIGGSYPQTGSALSNCALKWLLNEAVKAGLLVDPDRAAMVLGLPTRKHHAAAEFLAPPDQPGIVHRSLRGPWWLLEFLPHSYYDKQARKEKWRIPLGHPRFVPDGAFIHPSVVERLHDPCCNYRPKNLAADKIVQLVSSPNLDPGSPATGRTDLYIYSAGQKPRSKTEGKLAIAAAIAAGLGVAWAVLARKGKSVSILPGHAARICLGAARLKLFGPEMLLKLPWSSHEIDLRFRPRPRRRRRGHALYLRATRR